MSASIRAEPTRKTDTTRSRSGRPPKEKNLEQAEIVETGKATMAQLASMFQTDSKSLPKRLQGLQSAGTNRRGYKVFDIREAASRIVRPSYEIEEYIRQMSPQELPPLLSKEFWNGQNARIKFEEQMGRLWPTDRVVECFGAGLAAMRMAILLLQDGVEREESLSEVQRAAVQRLMDSAINTAREAIEEKMKEYDSAHELEGDGEIHGLEGPSDPEDDDGNILAAPRDEEEDIGI